LFDCEGADREIDGRTLFEQQQGFEKRHRVLATGQPDSQAVAIANHFEAIDGLTDLAQKCFFELH